MKRALVCGAGGFIASHLVKRLKADGYSVAPFPLGIQLGPASFPFSVELSEALAHLRVEARDMELPELGTIGGVTALNQFTSSLVTSSPNFS